jgi:phosphohistidine phosphatase
MKTLLFIRHAKSSWSDGTLSDFERPLNDRGKQDAPVMASRLKNKDVNIDAFVSSPAKRALSTAILFAETYNVKKKNIITYPELYHAEPEIFTNVIASLDNNFASVAIFSHNPSITFFINGLTNVHVDDMPTCAVFAVKTAITEWKEFVSAEKSFWFFDYPKNS